MQYSDELASAVNLAKSPEELVTLLLSLDQKYPETSEIKANLGLAYIMAGEVDHARVFLTSAEKLLSRKSRPDIAYQVYIGMADVNSRVSNYKNVREYARKALDLDVGDSSGAIVLIARAEAGLGLNKESIAHYTEAIKDHSAFFLSGDYSNYLSLLTANEDWEEALSVYLVKLKVAGYEPGDGLAVSAIYEKMALYTKSLIAAGFELMRLHDDGLVSSSDAGKRFLEVYVNVRSAYNVEDEEFGLISKAFVNMLDNNWKDSGNAFASDACFHGDCFEQFFHSVTHIMAHDNVSIDQITRYVNIEPYFRNLQSYYYYLWIAMKKGDGKYTFSTVRNILDKTMVLGPLTRMAEKSRYEAGNLLGLSDSESIYILPRLLVIRTLNEYFSTRDESKLADISGLLGIANNSYTSDCVDVLRNYAFDEDLKAYLQKEEKQNNRMYSLRLSELFG